MSKLAAGVDPVPADRAGLEGGLSPHHRDIGIGGIVLPGLDAPRETVRWCLEPETVEASAFAAADLSDGLPLLRTQEHRVDQNRVATIEGLGGLVVERAIDLLGRLALVG